MGIARFEEISKNTGVVHMQTYFNEQYSVKVEKPESASFKLGGTAVNEIAIFEGLILDFLPNNKCRFRAYKTDSLFFEGIAEVSPEKWSDDDTHCWVLEYYDLEMEGKPVSWLACKNKLSKIDCIFINLDIVDASNKISNRYRISPFFCSHKIVKLEW